MASLRSWSAARGAVGYKWLLLNSLFLHKCLPLHLSIRSPVFLVFTLREVRPFVRGAPFLVEESCSRRHQGAPTCEGDKRPPLASLFTYFYYNDQPYLLVTLLNLERGFFSWIHHCYHSAEQEAKKLFNWRRTSIMLLLSRCDLWKSVFYTRKYPGTEGPVLILPVVAFFS